MSDSTIIDYLKWRDYALAQESRAERAETERDKAEQARDVAADERDGAIASAAAMREALEETIADCECAVGTCYHCERATAALSTDAGKVIVERVRKAEEQAQLDAIEEQHDSLRAEVASLTQSRDAHIKRADAAKSKLERAEYKLDCLTGVRK
jgi:hypothetical protein